MKQKDLIKNVETICRRLEDTLKRKNADYGNSFSKLYGLIGMTYAYGHMAEKLERIFTLMSKESEVGESIDDSLLDLAGYAILTLAHRMNAKENTERPLEETCSND